MIITGIVGSFFNPTPILGGAATIKAFPITLDIAIILIGALTFLKVFNRMGIMHSIQRKLVLLTLDHRLQAILIAWLLGDLLKASPALVHPP